jgi:hypothetical protein
MVRAGMARRWGSIAAGLLVAAFLLAGCGGSSGSSAQRTRLLSEISAQLSRQSVPADLATCIVKGAHALSTGQLKAVATPKAQDVEPSIRRLTVGLMSTCVQHGAGAAPLRTSIVNSFDNSAPSSLPAAFKQCFLAKANAMTTTQLAGLISADAESSANETAKAQKLGHDLGASCLTEPSVIDALRVDFTRSFRQSFAHSSYSAAFKKCVIGKAEAVPAATLTGFALDQATSQRVGFAFGKKAATQCVAEGHRP